MNKTRSTAARAPNAATRVSVSIPKEQYPILKSIADEQRVSLAWVVRDAIESYLRQRWPLIKD